MCCAAASVLTDYAVAETVLPPDIRASKSVSSYRDKTSTAGNGNPIAAEESGVFLLESKKKNQTEI